MVAPNFRRAANAAAAKVACTHVVVNRARNCTCSICGKKPAIGWVYSCAQDDVYGKDPWETLASQEAALTPAEPAISDVDRLRAAGCSRSIVESAEKGVYSHLQVLKLLSQRQSVKSAIARLDPKKIQYVDADGVASTAPIGTLELHLDECAGDLAGACSQMLPEEVRRAQFRHKKRLVPPCRFKACHSCRPYFRDRLPESFDAIFSNEVKAPHRDEVSNFPVSSAALLRNLRAEPVTPKSSTLANGSLNSVFEPSPSPSLSASNMSLDSTLSDQDVYVRTEAAAKQFYSVRVHSGLTTEDSIDYGNSDMAGQKMLAQLQGQNNTPTTPSFRYSLRQAIADMFQPKRVSSSDGSSITLPLTGTGRDRSLEDDGQVFDLDVIRKGLEEARYGGNVGAAGVVASAPMLARDVDSMESVEAEADMEMNVDGGVALTEEAVETHTPDIMTQV